MKPAGSAAGEESPAPRRPATSSPAAAARSPLHTFDTVSRGQVAQDNKQLHGFRTGSPSSLTASLQKGSSEDLRYTKAKGIPLSARRGFSIDSLDGGFLFSRVGSEQPATSEQFKHEHRKISTSNVTKILKDGVLQETRETTNQQVKRLQAGDLHYHEARHSQQVKDKVEGEGFSAERVAAQRQDRKVLTCGDQSNERNMESKAMASRVVTADGTLENVAMAKDECQKQFSKGVVGAQRHHRQTAASRTLTNADGVTKVSSRYSSDRSPSPHSNVAAGVTSPDGAAAACAGLFSLMTSGERLVTGAPPRPALTSNNPYVDVVRQLQEDFRALADGAAIDGLNGVIGRFRKQLQIFLEKLKDTTNRQDCIRILQAMTVSVRSAWAVPTYGHELGFEMCNVLRDGGGLSRLIALCDQRGDAPYVEELKFEAARLLEQALSPENRRFVVQNGLQQIVNIAISCAYQTSADRTRVGSGLLCHLFKHSEETCTYLIEHQALDAILYNCRSSDVETLRHCATALANLALYGGAENHKIMIEPKRPVPMWLFPLAFHRDDNIKYWACLAISALCANNEIEAFAARSGTLELVEPFCMSRNPEEFARSNLAHVHGQSRDWLERFVPVLNSNRKEARSLAAFHFAMEASIKRRQGNTAIFSQIGAIAALKMVASSPNDIASKFAAQALRIIGEELPHSLSQQVPLWTEQDVEQWVRQVGFADRADEFLRAKVDGDLLLQIDEAMLQNDIGIQKQLLRKRFARELRKLKQMADYSSVDPTNLSQVLAGIDPEFRQYTYAFLHCGVDATSVSRLNDQQLQRECCIENSVHRSKILHYLSAFYSSPQEVDQDQGSRKNIDIFISYRRSNGSQLASLLKVHLQLKGFTVFLDVERLEAGKFDNNLLNSIRQAKTFILVLTPNALDRCKNDIDCKDWVHKEIVEAIQADCNIIPIMDNFVWPDVAELPEDIQHVPYYNAVKWIHDYQDACVEKIERFVRGDRQATEKAGTVTPASPRSWAARRAASAELERPTPVAASLPRETSASTDALAAGCEQPLVEMPLSPTPND